MKPSLVSFESALLVIDVQEGLLDALSDPMPMLTSLDLLQKTAIELEVPVIQTLQNPAKLGSMPEFLEQGVAESFDKKSFNALYEAKIRRYVEEHPASQWVVAGLETHICVLQTAKELARLGKQVVVAADACSSLNIYDYASALSELRAEGIRVSTVQTIIFEWLKSCEHPSFPTVLKWIKKQASGCCGAGGCQSSGSCGCGSNADQSSSGNCGCC